MSYHKDLNICYHEDFVRNIIVQGCQGLHYLHSLNVIHSNIKPSNILINYNGIVKLCDFGYDNLSTLGSYCQMTKQYFAPEKEYNGSSRSKSDLYSFGIVICEMCYFRLPYTEEFKELKKSGKLNITPKTTTKNYSFDIKNLIQKMTERNINLRPSIDQIIGTVTFQKLQRNLSNKADKLDESILSILSSKDELNINTDNIQDIDKELFRLYKIKNKEGLDQFYNHRLDQSLIHFKEALKIMNQLKGKYIREINYTNYYIQKIHDQLKRQNQIYKIENENQEDGPSTYKNDSLDNLTNSYTYNYFKKRNYIGSLKTCKNNLHSKRKQNSMHNNSPEFSPHPFNKEQFSVNRNALKESFDTEKPESDYLPGINSCFINIASKKNMFSNLNRQIRIPKPINNINSIEAAAFYFKKGLHYFNQDDFSDAIDYFKKSVEIYQTYPYEYDFNLGILYLNLGKAYSKLNFSGLAITHFMKSSQKFKNLGNKEMESEAISELSLVK